MLSPETMQKPVIHVSFDYKEKVTLALISMTEDAVEKERHEKLL